MAKWAVQSVAAGTSGSTHSLAISPRALIALGGSTSAPDTTKASVAAVGVGISTAGTTGAWETVYAGAFTNSSAVAAAGSTGFFVRAGTTAGGLIFQDLTTLTSSRVSVEPVLNAFPFGYVVVGGEELDAKATTAFAVSTLASTQASTGYGFQPNAAVVLGQSFVSSVANFSFGFACQTSDGTIKQWSIDQTAREGVGAAAYRSASTAHALKLHTSASTAHAVRVSSVKADGLELTVDATDTNRAATISILGLSVPKVDAGKATITTNGAGTGQTGFTVTGLGQNVGLVILASIGSSLQTLQPSNAFSIGFASSNGNQRCVSGYVQTTEETGAGSMNSSRYCSYFGTSHAVIFTSASAANGPLVDDKGAFAVTTDGFTVTFGSTIPNGRDVYWGAFMNVVSDIGGAAQSSLSAGAGVAEVGHIGGQTAAELAASLGLTPEFVQGEGKVHHDSEVRVVLGQDANVGMGFGASENSREEWVSVQTNSSSPDLERYFDVTTIPQRLGLAEFGNANNLTIIPPSTNTVPLRLSGMRTGLGIPISSTGIQNLPIAKRVGSDVYLLTTQEGSTAASVRVLIR